MSLRSWLPRPIVQALGLQRRWGVRYGGGTKERTGFTRWSDAETFRQDHAPAVCFEYEPAVDLRIDAKRASSRVRYVGDGGVS